MKLSLDGLASGLGSSFFRPSSALLTMPLGSPSRAGRSKRIVGTLELTRCAAICAPITPAPSTATFLICNEFIKSSLSSHRAHRDHRENRYRKASPLCVLGDRGAPDLDDVRVKAHHVAHEQRLLEDEGIHRDGHHPSLGAVQCEDAAGDIYLSHDPAAEYIAAVVAVGGHRHHAQGRFVLRQGGGVRLIFTQ